MSMFDEKYFSYIASSYGITFLVFAGLILWSIYQHRVQNAKLAALEKLGITRRSDNSAKVSKT